MRKKFKKTFRFKPFSKKQRKVLNWWCPDSPVKDKDGIIADGAIRSGKTVSMSLSFVMWAMTTFNGENFAMCGKTIGSFRRNVLTILKLMLRSRGYKVTDHRADNLVVIRKNGIENSFYIFGGKDESSQDLIQGITLAGVFFDEVALMPESFVNQATGRCSVDGSKFWFNCNPDGPYHWFKVNWIDKTEEKNLLYLHFTMEDNPSLSEKIKARYRSMYTGVFFQRYILGLWVVAEGIIYDMFDAAKHVKNVVDFFSKLSKQACYVSCDYGTQNATVFLLWNKGTDKKWYCVKEYYYSGRDEKKQKTDEEFVNEMIDFIGDAKVRAIIVDPSAASFITALNKKGLPTMKAKNDVLDGIRTVASLLNIGQIVFSDSCIETQKEFASYVWDSKACERGEDAPVKANDHCLTGDTLIDTIDGQVPIEQLVGKRGKVYCYNRFRKRKTVSTFYNVRKTQENAVVYEITLEDGTAFKATKEHPVLTTEGWKRVGALTGSDSILKTNIKKQNIARYVKVKSIQEAGRSDVYNMEVKHHHNFSICGGFIVHNCMDAVRYFCYTILAKSVAHIKDKSKSGIN